MIQIRKDRTTTIHIPFNSLYPVDRPSGIQGDCVVELHKTIGGNKRIYKATFEYIECGKIYKVPFALTDKLRGGEWTINVYIEIDGQLYRYVNLANLL